MRAPLSTRAEGELTLRRFTRLRFVSWIAIAQMVFLPLLSVDLRAQTPNVIIPDGRTGTSLQTSGNVTNITTSTVSGNNAFNSFSQFGVGQGNTVNLQLPNGSQNLINIVRDAPAYVKGRSTRTPTARSAVTSISPIPTASWSARPAPSMSAA